MWSLMHCNFLILCSQFSKRYRLSPNRQQLNQFSLKKVFRFPVEGKASKNLNSTHMKQKFHRIFRLNFISAVHQDITCRTLRKTRKAVSKN